MEEVGIGIGLGQNPRLEPETADAKPTRYFARGPALLRNADRMFDPWLSVRAGLVEIMTIFQTGLALRSIQPVARGDLSALRQWSSRKPQLQYRALGNTYLIDCLPKLALYRR